MEWAYRAKEALREEMQIKRRGDRTGGERLGRRGRDWHGVADQEGQGWSSTIRNGVDSQYWEWDGVVASGG